MVCTLPSARSLSKARSEGALRENMAKADMRTSDSAISTSAGRSSGMWSKPVCTNRKSASAERCLRALGATLAMGIPVMRRSQRSSQGLFSHQCLRKAMAADPVRTGLAGSAGIAGVDEMPLREYLAHLRGGEMAVSADQDMGLGPVATPKGQEPNHDHRMLRA